MDKPSGTKVVWEGRPSMWHYFSSYFIAVVGIIILAHLQLKIASDPYELVTQYGNWHRPLNEWTLNDWPLLVITGCYIIMLILVLNCFLKLLQAKLTRFLLEDEQIIVRKFTPLGIIEHRTEMYRIIDYTLTQTFLGVFFGLAIIRLKSTDQATPEIILFGVRKGRDIVTLLRQETEKCRMKKGVREFTHL